MALRAGKGGGPERELPLEGTACWCSPCPRAVAWGSPGWARELRSGDGGCGHGVQARRAPGRPPPALFRALVFSWKMGRNAGPSPGHVATAPGLNRPCSAATASRRPSARAPSGSRTSRPGPKSPPPAPPQGRSLCRPRPSPSPAQAGAPPAQPRRVTRGARLRRPPQAGASGGGGGGQRAGGMAAAGTAAGPAGPEPMPSYAQLVQRSWGSALAAARGCADCGWGLARRGLAEHAHLAPPELLLLALGALGWTALRSAATKRLFRVSAAGGRAAGSRAGGPGCYVGRGTRTPGPCGPLSASPGGVTGTRGALGWSFRAEGGGGGVDAGVWPSWRKAGTWGPLHGWGVRDVGEPGPTYAGRCGTRGPRPVGGPGPPRALSGRAEPRAEERRTRGGMVSGHRSRWRLAPWGHAGRARNRSGARGPRGRRADLSAAPGKRQELPGCCLAHVWSQRHPPTWGGKGLDSPATPVVAILGGGAARVFRAGPSCL